MGLGTGDTSSCRPSSRVVDPHPRDTGWHRWYGVQVARPVRSYHLIGTSLRVCTFAVDSSPLARLSQGGYS